MDVAGAAMLCAACWQPFDVRHGRAARLLPCLHMICEACLADLRGSVMPPPPSSSQQFDQAASALAQQLTPPPPWTRTNSIDEIASGYVTPLTRDKAKPSTAELHSFPPSPDDDMFDIPSLLRPLMLVDKPMTWMAMCSVCGEGFHEVDVVYDVSVLALEPTVRQQRESLQCEQHPTREVRALCLSCNTHICVECVLDSATHGSHRLRALDEIATTPQPDVTSTENSMPSPPLSAGISRCNEHHHAKVRAVCALCHAVVCSECLLKDRHGGHPLWTFDEARSKYRVQLEPQARALQRTLDSLEIAHTTLQHQIEELDAHVDHLEEYLQATLDGLPAPTENDLLLSPPGPLQIMRDLAASDVKTLQLHMDNLAIVKDYTLAAVHHALAVVVALGEPMPSDQEAVQTIELVRLACSIERRLNELQQRDPTLSTVTKSPSSLTLTRRDPQTSQNTAAHIIVSHGLLYDIAPCPPPGILRGNQQFSIKGPCGVIATGRDSLIILDFPSPHMHVLVRDGTFRYTLHVKCPLTNQPGRSAVTVSGDIWTINSKRTPTVIDCYSAVTQDGGGRSSLVTSFACKDAEQITTLSSGEILVGSKTSVSLFTHNGRCLWSSPGLRLHSSQNAATLTDSGEIAICDPDHGRLVMVAHKTGNVVHTIGDLGAPIAVAYARDSDVLAVIEDGPRCVCLIPLNNGEMSVPMNRRRVGEGVLVHPVSLAVLADGSIAVADASKHNISIFFQPSTSRD